MRRREFIKGLGGSAISVWPIRAYAQQPHRMRRIGVLIPWAENDAVAQNEFSAFRDGLRRLGWIDGRNTQIQVRWAAGEVSQIETYAKELVAWQPDVLVARTTPPTAALLKETRTIPIVFVGPSDPVGAGFAKSIARPGGNATGFTNVEASLSSKWVQLLKETDQRITRIAVMYDPKTSPGSGSFYLRAAADAGPSISVKTFATPVHNEGEIERAIGEIASDPGGGLVVTPDITTQSNRLLIISLTARHRLPAIYAYRSYVAAGGLMSYGVSVVDLYRQAAKYVDRILHGEKPDQLAIQAPTQFELAVNQKTAVTLGITLPLSLLSRADEVIE